MTHRIQDAPDVDVEDATVFGFGGVIQRPHPLHAGVVEGDVEPAEFFDRKIDHPFHVRIFRHVGADERRLAAEFLNFSHDLCAFFFPTAGQNDLSASTSDFDRGWYCRYRMFLRGVASILPENVLLFMELIFPLVSFLE